VVLAASGDGVAYVVFGTCTADEGISDGNGKSSINPWDMIMPMPALPTVGKTAYPYAS
jgi:hypothetical protein